MKRTLTIIMTGSLLLFYFFLGNAGLAQNEKIQQEISDEVLRLHVRANSDSRKDQHIKMAVKEAVVKETASFENEMYDKVSAKEAVSRHFKAIKDAAKDVLEAYQADYGVDIKIGREWFPRKSYGDISFPEGEYDAAIIAAAAIFFRESHCLFLVI